MSNTSVVLIIIVYIVLGLCAIGAFTGEFDISPQRLVLALIFGWVLIPIGIIWGAFILFCLFVAWLFGLS